MGLKIILINDSDLTSIDIGIHMSRADHNLSSLVALVTNELITSYSRVEHKRAMSYEYFVHYLHPPLMSWIEDELRERQYERKTKMFLEYSVLYSRVFMKIHNYILKYIIFQIVFN
jgi:hypothetical protein